MAFESVNQSREGEADTIEMPAPTPWPTVLAFGLTLVFAGLVTSEAVSVLGAILSIAGAVGWFRDVLPHEAHESVQAVRPVPSVTTMRREVAQMEIAREVQNQLFPKDVPFTKTLELKGVCHPARMVSGDYYDFMALTDHSLAFAIGAGSQMLQPLAIALVGGLFSSMVLSLVFTPAIHYYLQRRTFKEGKRSS